MYCNGIYTKPIIFLFILLMGLLVESSASTEAKPLLTKRQRQSITKSLDNLSGNLYDVFKRGLDLTQDELHYEPNNERFKEHNGNWNKQMEAVALPTLSFRKHQPSNSKRSSVKDDLYEEYKARMDKYSKGPNLKMCSRYTDRQNTCRSSRGLLNWFHNLGKYLYRAKDNSTKIRINATKKSNELLDKVLHDVGSTKSIKQELIDEYQKQMRILEDNLAALNKLQSSSNPSYTTVYTTKSPAEYYDADSDLCFEARQWLKRTHPLFTHRNHDFHWPNELSRRQIPSKDNNTKGLVNASGGNPSMLSRAVHISLHPANKSNNGNLLGNVATKLNISALELAQNIAKSENINPLTMKANILPFQDPNTYSSNPYQNNVLPQAIAANYPQLQLQNVSKVDANANTNAIANAYVDANANHQFNLNHNFAGDNLKNPNSNGAVMPTVNAEYAYAPPQNMFPINPNSLYQTPSREEVNQSFAREKIIPRVEDSNSRIDHELLSNANLNNILDEVLKKLKIIQEIKQEEHPNGTPCQFYGNWSSQLLGFCFSLESMEPQSKNESQGHRSLNINIHNCVQPKSQHNTIIDLSWRFTGSLMKESGGPIHIFAEKTEENLVATFLGFCRTCGGIDTIFGGWHFLRPSKDCSDILMAFEFKHDIMTRLRLDDKIKARLKKLYHKIKKK